MTSRSGSSTLPHFPCHKRRCAYFWYHEIHAQRTGHRGCGANLPVHGLWENGETDLQNRNRRRDHLQLVLPQVRRQGQSDRPQKGLTIARSLRPEAVTLPLPHRLRRFPATPSDSRPTTSPGADQAASPLRRSRSFVRFPPPASRPPGPRAALRPSLPRVLQLCRKARYKIVDRRTPLKIIPFISIY